MKKFTRRCKSGIVAASLLATALIPSILTAMPADAAVSGDLNNDGNVTATDVLILENGLLKNSAMPASADVTGDGIVNGMDLTKLRQMAQTDPVTDIIYIHLNDGNPYVEGDTTGATSVSGKTVTIKSSGTYYVDGTITDGQILVNVADTTADAEAVELYLNSVTMTSTTGAPCINATSADKVKITTIGESTLSDTATTANAETSGVIYGACDLTFTKNSTAKLTVNSIANIGIYSTDDIKFNGGSIKVDTDDDDNADADAIKAKNTVEIDGCNLKVESSADGIKSTKDDVTVTSGTVDVKAGNDAIQAATDITISSGTVVASGDRGFTLDANGNLNITGGDVLATATDNQIDFSTINTSATNQAVMALSYAAQHTKTETIQVGSVTMTANKKYQYALISSASLAKDGSYTVKTGDVAMHHSTDASGTFQNTGVITSYYEVQGDGSSTTTPSSAEGAASSLVYASSSITAYNADGAVISNPTNVTISGTTATVTSNEVDEIAVSGSCSQGQLVVDIAATDAQIKLSLQGLTLSNSTAAPIYVISCDDECVISAKDGTTNTISDGTSHTDYDDSDVINAAIYSKEDLKLKGNGTLIVNGNYQDGIVSKDTLKVWNGTIQVNAVDDCIRGKDAVKIGDPDATDYSTLNVTCTSTSGDGIKATNTDDTTKGDVVVNGGTVKINAFSDGIQGESDVTINGGTLDIYTYQGADYTASGSSSSSSSSSWGGPGGMGGGGQQEEGNSNKVPDDLSAKGIKSSGTINLLGGTATISSSDDAVHAAGIMNIYGGSWKAGSADDAFHSDTTINVGESTSSALDCVEVYAYKCYEGVEAPTINQNSGIVYVVSSDDGYNAGGGSDSSGTGGGWGYGQQTTTSSSTIVMNLNGGLVMTNSASGDHDAFDSNGNIYITGGYYYANGQEPIDCGDGCSTSQTGGNYISMSAGNTSLSTRYTLCDSSNNVIASWVGASGSVSGTSFKDGLTLYTGGTISGTNVATLGQGDIYISGTLSNGTTVSASGGSSQGGGSSWGGGGFGF